jgi:hypothetical protein
VRKIAVQRGYEAELLGFASEWLLLEAVRQGFGIQNF